MQMSQMNAPTTVSPDFAEESPADEAADEEREFIRRFNGLSRALSAFAETYKHGQVDLKQVNAVRKAMHESEKSEWFRLQKTEVTKFHAGSSFSHTSRIGKGLPIGGGFR
jgi:hypothetical protein